MTNHYKRLMNIYPLSTSNFSREAWDARVAAMHMLSFQVEKDNLPIVIGFGELIDRILNLPLEQTLQDEVVEAYFFQTCIPKVCDRLLRSKYFKDPNLLIASNQVLQLSMKVFIKYFHMVDKHPGFSQLIESVFNRDHMYFEHNNQLSNESYPWKFYLDYAPERSEFIESLKAGDDVDAIKYSSTVANAASWSRATVLSNNEDMFSIKFHNTVQQEIQHNVKSALQVAPFQTKSKDFQWRLNLTTGDEVDFNNRGNVWFRSTVVDYKIVENGKVVLLQRQYGKDESDDDSISFGQNDENGIDVMSPRIQPIETVLKFITPEGEKIRHVSCLNDHLVYEIGERRITVAPRHNIKSEILFNICRTFIETGGMDKLFKKLKEKINPEMMLTFLSGIGSISVMFHVNYAQEIYLDVKNVLDMYTAQQEFIAELLKENKFNVMMKSIGTHFESVIGLDACQIYQNGLRKMLALKCLNSPDPSLKLDSIAQLEQIFKNEKSSSDPKRILDLDTWIRTNQLFQKLFLSKPSNALLKKLQKILNFLVLRDCISDDQIRAWLELSESLGKKSTTIIYDLLENAVALCKQNISDCLLKRLFEIPIPNLEISHLSLILSLSLNSKSFPVPKAVKFFETLLLDHKLKQQEQVWLLQKYAQHFVTLPMIQFWQEHIVLLIWKLTTDKVLIACKMLMGVILKVQEGEEHKYLILEHIDQANLYHFMIKAFELNTTSPQRQSIHQHLLYVLKGSVYYIGMLKISAQLLVQLYNIFMNQQTSKTLREHFCQVFSNILSNMSVFRKGEREKLQDWFVVLTSLENIQLLNQQKLGVIIEVFTFINKAQKNIAKVQCYTADDQEEMLPQRIAPFNSFKYHERMVNIICNVPDQKVLQKAVKHYKSGCTLKSQEQSASVRDLNEVLDLFFKFYRQGEYLKASRVLILLDILMDESQRWGPSPLKSLQKYRKGKDVMIYVRPADINSDDYSGIIGMQSNQTIFDLKFQIAKHLRVTWRQVKLKVQNNSNCLNKIIESETSLYSNCLYSKVDSPPNHSLLQEKKFVPKAKEVFRKVFKRFAENGYISKEQCKELIIVCLGAVNTKTYDDRIQSFYSAFDDNRDHHLTEQNFLGFFEEASHVRPSTVWHNLQTLNYRYDFEEIDSAKADTLVLESIPRHILSENQKFVDALFHLVLKKDQGRGAWHMLETLGVNDGPYQQLLKFSLQEIITLQNPEKTFYYLHIISDLLVNSQSQQIRIDCKEKLLKDKIFEKLFRFLGEAAKNIESKEINFKVCEIILDIVSDSLLSKFKTSSNFMYHQVIIKWNCLESLFQDLISAEESKKKQTERQDLEECINISGEENYNLLIEAFLSVINGFKLKKPSELALDVANGLLSLLLTSMLYSKSCQEFLKLLPLLMNSDWKSNQFVLGVVYCLFYSQEITDKQLITHSLISLAETLPESPSLSKDSTDDNAPKELAITSNIPSNLLLVLRQMVESWKIQNTAVETRNNLFSKVVSCKDQVIVELSAFILSNIEMDVSHENIQEIWVKCLFGQPQGTLKSPVARREVYKLLLKLVNKNPQLSLLLGSLTASVLKPCLQEWKPMRSQQLKRINQNLIDAVGLRSENKQNFLLPLIQVLYSIPQFKYFILHSKPNQYTKPEQTGSQHIIHELQKAFRYLQLSKRQSYDASDLINCFGDCSMQGNQQFSHFSVQVSEILHKIECSLMYTSSQNLIDNLFRGSIARTIMCNKCNTSKVEFENFLCLDLNAKFGDSITISKALARWQKSHQKKCEVCSQMTSVTSRILRFPRILLISPNRFIKGDSDEVEQFSNMFQFEQTLNIAQVEQKYQTEIHGYQHKLESVITYSGDKETEAGRFWSQIMIPTKQQWVSYDGGEVQSFSEIFREWLWFGNRDEDEDMFRTYDGVKKDLLSTKAQLLVFKRDLEPIQVNEELLPTFILGPNQGEQNENEEELSPRMESMLKHIQNRMPTEDTTLFQIPSPAEPPLYPLIDKQIQDDNQLLDSQHLICSSQFIEFYSNLLLCQTLPLQHLKQLVETSFKMLLKIWLIQPERHQIIDSILKIINKNISICEHVMQSSHFKALISLQLQQKLRASLQTLTLQSIRKLTPPNSEISTRVSNVLLAKQGLLEKVAFDYEPQRVKEVKFWLELVEWNPSAFMRFIAENNVTKLFVEHLMIAKDAELQKMVIRVLEFIRVNDIQTDGSHERILTSDVILPSINSHHHDLCLYIIDHYCKNNMKISQSIVKSIATSPSSDSDLDKESTILKIYKLLSIEDQHQLQRLKLIVGTPVLNANWTENTVACFNSNKFFFVFTSPYGVAENDSPLQMFCSPKTSRIFQCIMMLALFDLSYRFPLIKSYLCSMPSLSIKNKNIYQFIRFSLDKHSSQEVFLLAFKERLSNKNLINGQASSFWRGMFEHFKKKFESENGRVLMGQNKELTSEEKENVVENKGWMENQYEVYQEYREDVEWRKDQIKEYLKLPVEQMKEEGAEKDKEEGKKQQGEDKKEDPEAIKTFWQSPLNETQLSYIDRQFSTLPKDTFTYLVKFQCIKSNPTETQLIQTCRLKGELVTYSSEVEAKDFETLSADHQCNEQNFRRYELTGMVVRNCHSSRDVIVSYPGGKVYLEPRKNILIDTDSITDVQKVIES